MQKASQRAVSRILFPPRAADAFQQRPPVTDDDHSSSSAIAGGVQRPTRRLGRAVLGASLFGLAPCGVLPATDVATGAVRSYRTFSPLLPCGSGEPDLHRSAVCFLCHFPSSCPDRALPGALPCGVRTFLPSTRRSAPRPGKPRKRGRPRAKLEGPGRTAAVWPAATLHFIVTRRFPVRFGTARVSCTGCFGVCRSLPRFWRCSSRSRAASTPGRRAPRCL